jgi:hypothetical protein
MITDEVTPVPLNATVCGLPVALSAMFNVAVRAPFALGVNSTLIVQLAPAASDPVGLHPEVVFGSGTPKSPAFVPLTVKPVKFTAAALLFVTVTLIGALVVVSACEPNVKLVGATVTVPAPGVPVPISVTLVICGVSLPAFVYVTVTVPVSVPVAVGVNVTFTTQLEPSVLPPTNVSGQLFVSPKFVLATTLEIVTVPVPTFTIATGCEGLVVFSTWLPKVSDVGFAVTFVLDRLPACTNTFESYK